MSTHLTKKEIRNPDIMTQELKKGFQWTTTHAKLVIFTSIAFIGAGVAYSAYDYFADQAEESAQEAFYRVEMDYQKLQESAKPKPAEKGDKTPAPKPVVVDYEPVAQNFAKVIGAHKDSRAAILAFLDFAEIKNKSQKFDEIVKNSESLRLGNDLLSALALMERGNAQANSKDCNKALSTWDQVLKIKQAQSIYPELHLQQALCYESLNDKSKAEENYNKVLAEAKDSSAAKSAEKYLRLLKTKVN